MFLNVPFFSSHKFGVKVATEKRKNSKLSQYCFLDSVTLKKQHPVLKAKMFKRKKRMRTRR